VPGAPQDLALPDEQPQATFALSPPQHTITLLIGCVLYAESSTLISTCFTLLSAGEGHWAILINQDKELEQK